MTGATTGATTGAIGVAGITGAAVVLAAAVCTILGPAPAAPLRAHEPFVPDDPGSSGVRGGWSDLQWNLAGPDGVDAPGAWANLAASGAPGAAGVTVAVLDTGIAVGSTDPSRPDSPDLAADRVLGGHDFVGGDADPYDLNGHGTHVASTIAEQTDNASGLAGLAYGVTLLPVRVLDNRGFGEPSLVARGVRYAVDHGAQVINLSLSFGGTPRPSSVRALGAALEEAHDRGVVVVVGAGNRGQDTVDYPASAPHVLAVGATTDSGCLASYSDFGRGLDLVAPGGGDDANVADPHCRPGRRGARVYQVTRSARSSSGFAIVGYQGTSMAAPHVSAAAALVIASGVLGTDPDPDAVVERLERTARDLGPPGYDRVYGWGLLDAAAATDPAQPTSPED